MYNSVALYRINIHIYSEVVILLKFSIKNQDN